MLLTAHFNRNCAKPQLMEEFENVLHLSYLL